VELEALPLPPAEGCTWRQGVTGIINEANLASVPLVESFGDLRIDGFGNWLECHNRARL